MEKKAGTEWCPRLSFIPPKFRFYPPIHVSLRLVFIKCARFRSFRRSFSSKKACQRGIF